MGRFREIFGVNSRSLYTDKKVIVNHQLGRDTAKLSPVKNKKKRASKILLVAYGILDQWFEEFPKPLITEYGKICTVAHAKRERNLNLYNLWIYEHHARDFRAYCKKAFPHEPDKHLSFHDLRHCFCIHLLGIGVHIKDVADSIGDTIATVESHYASHILTDEDVERIQVKEREREEKKKMLD